MPLRVGLCSFLLLGLHKQILHVCNVSVPHLAVEHRGLQCISHLPTSGRCSLSAVRCLLFAVRLRVIDNGITSMIPVGVLRLR